MFKQIWHIKTTIEETYHQRTATICNQTMIIYTNGVSCSLGVKAKGKESWKILKEKYTYLNKYLLLAVWSLTNDY